MKKILLTALYSVFLVAMYQLIGIPLLLDFSYIGLLILVAGTLLAFWSIPRSYRKQLTVMSLLILLVSIGITNIYSDTLLWRFVNLPIMFLILAWIASSFGHIKWRYTFTIFTVFAVLLSIVPLTDWPFYAKFQFKAKSDALDRRPIFNVYPIVNLGDKIYTFGDATKLSNMEIKDATPDPNSTKDQSDKAVKQKQQLETVDMLRFLPSEGYKQQTVTKEEMSSLPFTAFGLAGVPYYSSSWTINHGAVKQNFTATDSPQQVLTSFFDPLSITVALDSRANRSVEASRANWAQTFGTPSKPEYPGAVVVGKGKFLPDGSTQLLLLGNNELRLVSESNPTGTPIASYKGTWKEPIAKNMVIGDIDNDGQDELLLNTSPAKILKIDQNQQWKQLWESGKKSLRFEFVTKQEGLAKPLIVAQDPSAVRNVDTRYLTGYTWNNGELEREWRVFKTNLLFPFVVSKDTWAMGTVGIPRVLVLKPTDFPTVPVLASIYFVLVIIGYGYQIVKRKETRHA